MVQIHARAVCTREYVSRSSIPQEWEPIHNAVERIVREESEE